MQAPTGPTRGAIEKVPEISTYGECTLGVVFVNSTQVSNAIVHGTHFCLDPRHVQGKSLYSKIIQRFSK